jgi:hypothetical protein
MLHLSPRIKFCVCERNTGVLKGLKSLPDDARPPNIGVRQFGVTAIYWVLSGYGLESLLETCFYFVIFDVETIMAGDICILFVWRRDWAENCVLEGSVSF